MRKVLILIVAAALFGCQAEYAVVRGPAEVQISGSPFTPSVSVRLDEGAYYERGIYSGADEVGGEPPGSMAAEAVPDVPAPDPVESAAE